MVRLCQELQKNNIVYFGFDKYDIGSDFAQMLDAHAAFLRSNPSYKVVVEGPYHELTNAGHISYIEMDAPPIHNLEAYESLLRHMAACNMGYVGINFPIDECLSCSHHGVIDETCPVCGSADIRRIRRITGYLSTVDRFNDAKKAELADRHAHTSKQSRIESV